MRCDPATPDGHPAAAAVARCSMRSGPACCYRDVPHPRLPLHGSWARQGRSSSSVIQADTLSLSA